jgi:sugar lactone lactonase YvrE
MNTSKLLQRFAAGVARRLKSFAANHSIGGLVLIGALAAPLAQAQNIATVAGGGPNNVPALSAGVAPGGIARDASGNIYFSDSFNNRVFKVDTSGLLTVVAGNGSTAGFNFSGDGGPAIAAELSLPLGLALDGAGNLFIADSGNNVIREVVAATGNIQTVAGNSNIIGGGFSGDGGPATSAQLSSPGSVAVDGAGNLFIADNSNNVIREVVAATGIIQTVAGNNALGAGFSGDGASAIAAQLSTPDGVSVDSTGNIFISDFGNNVIREVLATTGIIQTVVGNGTAGFSGDGGPAINAELNQPSCMYLDAAGNLFIADFGNNVIREVLAANGSIQTVAGTGTPGFSGDGGLAINAELFLPAAVTADGAGNLFITDFGNSRVRDVAAASGNIQTLAGNGTFSFSGDGGPATKAELQSPEKVVADGSGNIFISDSVNNVIREVVAATGNIQTVAGNNALGAGFSGDGGPAIAAQFNLPTGMTLDAAGNLFIADAQNNVIREVVAATGNIQTVAGNNALGAGYSGDGGPATGAQLSGPASVAVDGAGNLFIVDESNNVIREVVAATGNIQTVAGNFALGAGYSGDGGPATSAQLRLPSGVFVDGAGNLFIADLFNNVIREVVAATGNIQTVAGNINVLGFGGDGGPATSAGLAHPTDVFVDGAGNLFIADLFDDLIREVVAATGNIQTVAGNGTEGFSGDGGLAINAQLTFPSGVFVDATGNIFITDSGNNRIREVLAQGALSPASLAFTSQNVGVASAAQTATLTNGGTVALSIASIAITGANGGDFAQSNTCGVSVAAGANCSISVVFTPTSGGARSASVTIDENGTIQTVALSGTGVGPAPQATLSAASLTFTSPGVGTASATQAIKLTNSGNAALAVSLIAITGTNAGDFAQTNTCGTSVAAGANCSISVTFTPTVTGPSSATVTITDTASGSPQSVALSGTVVAPAPQATLSVASLTFNTGQGVGTSSAAQSVTLTNGGNAALSITAIAITGANNGDFSQTNTCGNSVAAGANCSIGVTFTPTVSGNRSAAVTITDNSSGSPQSISLAGIATDFTIAVPQGTATTATVPAGQPASFSFQINPTGAQQTVALTCTGAPQAATCTVPATVNVAPGTPATVNVTVSTVARSFTVPMAPRGMQPPATWPVMLALLAALALLAQLSSKLLRSAGSVQPVTAWLRLNQRFALAMPLAMLLLSAAWLSGCGSKSTPPGTQQLGTPAGTSTLTVKATSNGVSHQTQFTLTVQ